MKLKNMMAMFGLVVCAASLVVGCGKEKSSDSAGTSTSSAAVAKSDSAVSSDSVVAKSDSAGASTSGAAVAKSDSAVSSDSAAAKKVVVEPCILDGSDVAILCDCRKDAARPEFKKMNEFGLKALDQVLPKIDELAALKDLIRKQAAEVGTEKGVRWMAITVGAIGKYELGKPIAFPEIGIAAAVNKASAMAYVEEVKKMVQGLPDAEEALKELKANLEVVEAEIEGCKACRLEFKGQAAEGLKMFQVSHLSPCWGWLGDELFLAASNEEQFAKLVNLYRDGKGASTSVSFDKSLFSCVVVRPGALVAQYVGDDVLGNLPGGAAFVKGLTNLRLSVGFSDDGKSLGYKISVDSDDKETARELSGQGQAFLGMAKAAVAGKEESEMSEEDKLAKSVLDSVKLDGLSLSAAIPVDFLLRQMEKEVKKLPSL